jgi:hypothetical protein
LAAATEQVMGTIAAQLPANYRGVYADAAQRVLAGESPVALPITPESQS